MPSIRRLEKHDKCQVRRQSSKNLLRPSMRTVALLLLGLVGVAFAGNCSWTDPSTGAAFDLSSLTLPQGSSETYSGNDGTYDYTMNVCGVSTTPGQCSQDNNAVCQFSSGMSFVASLGMFSGGQPTWALVQAGTPSAGVQYTFTNGNQCWIAGRMVQRTVIVQFLCSNDPPTLTFSVSEDQSTCTFMIQLKTAVACPGSQIPCNYTDSASGASFDLSPLTRPSTSIDYQGVDSYYPYTYAMNLCAPSNTLSCRNAGGAFCQYDNKGALAAVLGSFNGASGAPPKWALISPSDPSIGVKLTYTNGDKCFVQGKQINRVATVSLVCDSQGQLNFTVVSTTNANTCSFNAKFFSPYACPSYQKKIE